MYCPNCGMRIPDDSRFCPHCGKRIDGSFSSEQDPVNFESMNGYAQSQGDYYSWDSQINDAPEHGSAVASLVLGIVGVALCFFGYSAVISVVLGIIGLILSNGAKKAGNTEGIRTAGFVLSLISLIGGAIVFIACIAIIGSLVKLAGLLTQPF